MGAILYKLTIDIITTNIMLSFEVARYYVQVTTSTVAQFTELIYSDYVCIEYMNELNDTKQLLCITSLFAALFMMLCGDEIYYYP